MKKVILFVIVGILLSAGTSQLNAQTDIWLANGEKELNKGNFEKAIELFTKVIERDKKNARAFFHRGFAYLNSNLFEQALTDLNEAVKIMPDYADAYNIRGLAYSYNGLIEQALNDFNKAIELDPKFAEAYLNRGSAHLAVLDYDNALKDFDKSIKINPNNPAVYYQRARIHNRMGKNEEAIMDFTKAIDNGLKTPKVYYGRGNSFFKANKFIEAIKDYTVALEMDPDDIEALNNRAISYDKAGMKDNAQADRERIAEMNRKHFPPIEQIQFKRFFAPDSLFSIELPTEWHFQVIEFEDAVRLTISKDEIDSSGSFMVGVSLTYHKNMSVHYETNTEKEILDFWENTIAQELINFYNHDIYTKKIASHQGWSCIINDVMIQSQEKYLPIRMYEVAYTLNDNLFFGFLQSPLQQFTYYKDFFDRALQSLELN